MYGTGLSLTRAAIAKAVVGGDLVALEGFARRRWGRDADGIVQHIKAPVAGNEAASMYGNEAGFDFQAAAFPKTLPGMLGVQRVGTYRPQLTQTTRASAHWVQQGRAIKAFAGGYTRDPGLRLLKVATLFVCSKETLEDAGAEDSIRQGLLTGFASEMNRMFIDPNNAGDDATPASLTTDATPIAMAGASIAHLDDALREALQALGPLVNMANVRVIMSAALAGCLSLARGTGGAPAYPALAALGGTLAGLGVLTYDGAENASSSDGEFIALVDGSAVSYTDEAPEIGIADDALIELDTAPTGDSITPTAASASLVSMFQEEAVCFRGIWRANWRLRRPDAVQVITGVPFELTA
jgi:HK97 family phage major capsid protein